jgi:hypothetical protein
LIQLVNNVIFIKLLHLHAILLSDFIIIEDIKSEICSRRYLENKQKWGKVKLQTIKIVRFLIQWKGWIFMWYRKEIIFISRTTFYHFLVVPKLNYLEASWNPNQDMMKRLFFINHAWLRLTYKQKKNNVQFNSLKITTPHEIFLLNLKLSTKMD